MTVHNRTLQDCFSLIEFLSLFLKKAHRFPGGPLQNWSGVEMLSGWQFYVEIVREFYSFQVPQQFIQFGDNVS